MTTMPRFQEVRSMAGNSTACPSMGRAPAEEPKLTPVTHFQKVRSIAGHRPRLLQHALGMHGYAPSMAEELKLMTVTRFQ